MPIFIRVVLASLTKLVQFPKFKQAIASKTGVASNLKNSQFVNKVKDWVTQNPMKAQLALASAVSVVPEVLPDVFSAKDLPVVAAEIQNVDFSGGPVSQSVVEMFDKKMGDGKAGMYGVDDSQLNASVTAIQGSIQRTERLAELLAVRPSDVGEIVRLILSAEPADQAIYTTLRK